jgi:3-oxoacyl-[acyl-carrier protein] reductase
MAGLLRGKVAIITGSGRGIGREAASLFASEGARLVVNDMDPEKAQEAAQEIQSAGAECIVVPGDVTDLAFADRVVGETLGRWGRIDVVVNNAGFCWDVTIHKMSDAQWESMMAVHLTAPFRLLRAVAPYFRDAATQESGMGKVVNRKVINISSLAGTRGNAGQSNYAAAKAGVVGLTKALAKEWGPHNVQVNAVSYGWIATRLTGQKEAGQCIERDGSKIPLGIPPAKRDLIPLVVPMGRPGTPREAAGPLLFLASSLSDYVSGQCIEVTGGY